MHKRCDKSQNPHTDNKVIRCAIPVLIAWVVLGGSAAVAEQAGEPKEADRMLAQYFESETGRLQDGCLNDVRTLDDWKARREVCRRQLLEMLGLEPFPEKTPLQATVTGTAEHEQFTVENLHYQSLPGLYVTGNLYVPKNLDKRAPAILYVCGHGGVKKDGISYGCKVAYQHHGAWFARHGYVCLTIDTLQLGEIEGIHHGTYRYGMWWWNSRGYTPAGVEAWNCVRALDYLETRKEVDPNRLGVTGRSGGGAYSWWIAAIDDRIKAAVPVAGITDLQNHVVNGCVEGHCDCMFTVNTYRWDYPMVAALVAPRPLLISNSDKDSIFPLDGVLRVHQKVRDIYRLYGAEKNLGLQITEGPHKDTQELRIHSFVWFNRFLKGEDPVISEPAVPFFEPQQLRVFKELPADQGNSEIHRAFVRRASPPVVPQSSAQWIAVRDDWMKALREKVFRGWPTDAEAGPLQVECAFAREVSGVCLAACDFTSQPHVRLRLFLARPLDVNQVSHITLNVLDEPGWGKWSAVLEQQPDEDQQSYVELLQHLQDTLKTGDTILAYVCPRGVGPTAWSGDERKQTQIQRRFMLLGQTLDGMRVWDVRRAIQALRVIDETKDSFVALDGTANMAGIALYAALFEPGVTDLNLGGLPGSHDNGPVFLNVLRFLDMPQVVAMATEKMNVTLHGSEASAWQFPLAVVQSLGWDHARLRIDSQ